MTGARGFGLRLRLLRRGLGWRDRRWISPGPMLDQGFDIIPRGASAATLRRLASASKTGAAPTLFRTTPATKPWLSGCGEGRGRSRASPAGFPS